MPLFFTWLTNCLKNWIPYHLREREKVDFDVKEMFARIEKSSGYLVIVPLDKNILKMLPDIKKVTEIHDKIITATALLYNSVLMTRDPEIVESGYVKTVWNFCTLIELLFFLLSHKKARLLCGNANDIRP